MIHGFCARKALAFVAFTSFALLCSSDEAPAQGKGGMQGGKAQAGAMQARDFLHPDILNNIMINIGNHAGGMQGIGGGGDKGGQGKGKGGGGGDKGGQGKGKGGGGGDKGGQGKGKGGGGGDKGGQGKGKGGMDNGGIGNMHPDIWIQIQIQIYIQQMAKMQAGLPANPIGQPNLNQPVVGKQPGGKQPGGKQPQAPVNRQPIPNGQIQMFNAMRAGGQVGNRNVKK